MLIAYIGLTIAVLTEIAYWAKEYPECMGGEINAIT